MNEVEPLGGPDTGFQFILGKEEMHRRIRAVNLGNLGFTPDSISPGQTDPF